MGNSDENEEDDVEKGQKETVQRVARWERPCAPAAEAAVISKNLLVNLDVARVLAESTSREVPALPRVEKRRKRVGVSCERGRRERRRPKVMIRS